VLWFACLQNQISITQLFIQRMKKVFLSRFMLLAILIIGVCAPILAANPLSAAMTVTGTVLDGIDNSPMIGVSVVIKNTTTGTITDLDGKYSVEVPNGETILVFSYVGYDPQEIKVGTQTLLNVSMKQGVALEQVVVVGYGVQKKSDVTGSVTSVPKERLAQLPVSNVLQAVQGAVAGVNITQSSSVPGSGVSALVRGTNSISAATGPFIVVDGIPFSTTGGSLNDINPNDIESMEILKDASAVAIYGTRGANGVILISTKRGKSGKPVIRYNTYIGVEDFAHVVERDAIRAKIC
jgi:TonB-dependent SusC/RagA subfamily outer membrane receptor